MSHPYYKITYRVDHGFNESTVTNLDEAILYANMCIIDTIRLNNIRNIPSVIHTTDHNDMTHISNILSTIDFGDGDVWDNFRTEFISKYKPKIVDMSCSVWSIQQHVHEFNIEKFLIHQKVICNSEFPKYVTNLEKRVKQMEQENSKLKEENDELNDKINEFNYRPYGPGYELAKKSFESVSKS